MLGAIVVAFRRRRLAPTGTPSGTPVSSALLQQIAALDARFEQQPAPSAETRAAYTAERDELKSRLAAALADERRPG
jgi:hypothetical protein